MGQWRYILSLASNNIKFHYVPATSGINFPQMLHDGEAILARVNGKSVGVMSFQVDETTKPIIVYHTAVEVLSRWRGKGIGKMLQEAFIAHLNGRFGMTNYTIHSVATTDEGLNILNYRKTLMFEPERQSIQELID